MLHTCLDDSLVLARAQSVAGRFNVEIVQDCLARKRPRRERERIRAMSSNPVGLSMFMEAGPFKRMTWGRSDLNTCKSMVMDGTGRKKKNPRFQKVKGTSS